MFLRSLQGQAAEKGPTIFKDPPAAANCLLNFLPPQKIQEQPDLRTLSTPKLSDIFKASSFYICFFLKKIVPNCTH